MSHISDYLVQNLHLCRLEARLARDLPVVGQQIGEARAFEGDTMMWVDEFAPRRYIGAPCHICADMQDLLSDEDANKKLMHWVKGWDPIVFHRYPCVLLCSSHTPEKRLQYISPLRSPLRMTNRLSRLHVGNPSRLQKKFAQPGSDETSKIVLLSGPPGVFGMC